MAAPNQIPHEETQLRLLAAAKLLTAAAEGQVFSVLDAVEGARRIIDTALDAEIDALPGHIQDEDHRS